MLEIFVKSQINNLEFIKKYYEQKLDQLRQGTCEQELTFSKYINSTIELEKWKFCLELLEEKEV